MRDPKVLEKLDDVARDLKICLGQANPQDIAKALSIPARDMNRLLKGSSESGPRVVKTEYFALIYYHLGVLSANPKDIPISLGRSRPWTEMEYQAWKKTQPEPMFVNAAASIVTQIKELIRVLGELVTSSDAKSANVLDALRNTDYRGSVDNLAEALAFVLDPDEDAAYLMQVRKWWEEVNE